MHRVEVVLFPSTVIRSSPYGEKWAGGETVEGVRFKPTVSGLLLEGSGETDRTVPGWFRFPLKNNMGIRASTLSEGHQGNRGQRRAFAPGDKPDNPKEVNFNLMKSFFPFLLVLSLQAQTITLTGPGTVTAGGTATLTVSVIGTATSNPAALQWTMGLPAGFAIGTPAATSSDPSGDAAYCGTSICLVAGSVTKLSDGNIATIPITVAPTAALGVASIALSGLFGADINGFNVNGLTSGALYSVTVTPSPCDVNGDGQINVADVLAVILGDIGKQACPISAANGGCSIVAIQQVIIAATGGACKVP